MTIGDPVEVIATGDEVTIIAQDPRNRGKFTVEDEAGHQKWLYPNELKGLDNEQEND